MRGDQPDSPFPFGGTDVAPCCDAPAQAVAGGDLARMAACGADAPGCPLFEILEVDPERASQTRWAQAWGLPPRCAMVAALMMRGLRDREIAERLGLATTSVRTYARSVLSRAGASSRVGLIHNALRLWVRRS